MIVSPLEVVKKKVVDVVSDRQEIDPSSTSLCDCKQVT